jgi:hypothetical protein
VMSPLCSVLPGDEGAGEGSARLMT